MQKSSITNHLAVAENSSSGSRISIHAYSNNMEVVGVCVCDANKHWAHLSYSCSGELLASQSSAPEFQVTIWNWQAATILLQFKSSQFRDNFDLKFSMQNERFMYSGGAKHVHFWDVVRTFTGLKLLHSFGHFGKFAACDTLTVCPESGNRLLTNCDWGNVLVWENGKILFEVCRKNRQPCHSAPITQITFCNEYLYTIATDSFVRIWFWDTVALANRHENQKFIEFEAVYEYEIKSICCGDELLSFTIDPMHQQYCYIHDGNGVIWKSVVDTDFTTHRLETIFRASSKNLLCLTVSPNAQQLVTLDAKGILCLYNTHSGKMVFHYRFPVASHSLVWCSPKVNSDPFKLCRILFSI